jgi:broad specificity phosphatase PhoE/CTP:molybdopterin cytidylyltransferase MocA/HD superfamily phosphodiesterase
MKEPCRIAALVLAAGYSSRMGIFKPLASLGTYTLIEEAVTRFFRAGVEDVRVVLGYRADELKPVVENLGARWIYNADFDRGMFSSVLAGVRGFGSEVDGFFLLPCDIPLVKPETIRTLLDAHDPDDPEIIYPCFDGRRGHPPLIPALYLHEDLSVDYPGGLPALLDRYEHNAVDIDVTDENILLDCDTPIDYLALMERRSTEGIPTERECAAVLSGLNVSGEVMDHSLLVAELARMLAVRLNSAGLALNLPLIIAAGRLHDIARGRPDHAGAGAGLLTGMGYPQVGAIVARHMDIKSPGPAVDEADLIYLVDKCVERNRLVSLEDRFEKFMARYADRPDIREKVRERFENARKIAERVEALLGQPVEKIMRGYESDLRAEYMGDCRMIYLARHGAVQSKDDPKRFIGQIDLPLNAQGRRQAEELTEALLGARISAVFCSDLKRSSDTAQIIAGRHRVSCVQRRDLREISLGRWEGLSFDEVRSLHPDEFQARGNDIVHYRPPDGESFLDCGFRVVPAFHEILNSTVGNILLVGHAGVNRIILSRALVRSLNDLLELDQDYGCLNLIAYRPPALEVVLLNGSFSSLKRLRNEL